LREMLQQIYSQPQNDTELALTNKQSIFDETSADILTDILTKKLVRNNTNNAITSDDSEPDTKEIQNLLIMLQKGGAKKPTNNKKKVKTNSKSKKQKVIKNKRVVKNKIELSEQCKKKSKDISKEISRATIDQKTKFLDEALAKIIVHVPSKDVVTAKAVRALLNTELKETKKELTSLDRASELLKIITESKINDILKKKADIQKIVDYINYKNTQPKKNTKKTSISSNV